MKEIKLYQCEICGTKYAEKLKAKECEKYHAKDLEITTRDYRGMNEGGGNYRFLCKGFTKGCQCSLAFKQVNRIAIIRRRSTFLAELV